MFGFEWSEIAVIAVVALICIGPKDMPVAIRAITGAIKKMRRMAGEFQGHVDEMLREADLHEVSDTIRDIRGLNMRSAITRAIDPDGSVGRSLSDPFQERPVPKATVRPLDQRMVPARDVPGSTPIAPEAAPYTPVTGQSPPNFPPPDFLPPGARPPAPGIRIGQPDFLPPRPQEAPTQAGDT